MKLFWTKTVAIATLIGLSGCASTETQPESRSAQDTRRSNAISIEYVSAQDDLGLVPSTTTSHLLQLSDDRLSPQTIGPYVSVARKCQTKPTLCKHGVVTVALQYTEKRIGNDWIIEGKMEVAMSRSASVTNGTAMITHTLPGEVPLIDDEPIKTRHFTWVARPGATLPLKGPGGASFLLRRPAENQSKF